MLPLAALPPEVVREALRVLGEQDVPPTRTAATRRLRELFATVGVVRDLIARAPEGARDAVVRLAHEGPAGVEELLGRGWWGHGSLPPPLDWAQRRALIGVADGGVVHAVDEVRAALLAPTLPFPADGQDAGGDRPAAGSPRSDPAVPGELTAAPREVRVEEVKSVVVAGSADLLQRALAASGARLRAVAPTVAVSDRSAATVQAALRAAGVGLAADAVAADPTTPALPGVSEEAVGPRGVRALLQRAVSEHRQVRLQYYASSRGGAATDRVVDPWSFADDLLRGWCHLRTDERAFAVDRVGRAILLPSPVQHYPPAG